MWQRSMGKSTKLSRISGFQARAGVRVVDCEIISRSLLFRADLQSC